MTKLINTAVDTVQRDLIDELEEIEDLHDKKITINISDNEKIKVNDQFVLMFVSNFQRLMEILTHRELKVLLALVKFSEYKNVFKVTQKALEKETGIKQSNISIILNKLKDKNFILEDEENGVEYINPFLFLKGSIKEFKKSDLYKQLYNADFNNIKNPF